MPPFPNMTFDHDLWPTHLKIYRDHLLIKDYLPTKFEASGAKPSWVISCTRLRETDIPTDGPTCATQYDPPFSKGGITRAQRGTERSPEYNEHFWYKLDSRVKNLTTEWNQKQQHFITHASRSLLWIRFVAVAFRSEEEVFWRRGPLVTYFASPWIRLWANMAKTSLCMCQAMSTSSLPSFVNIHWAVL